MNAHAKIAATATLAQLKPGQDYPDGNINARLHYTDAEIDELAASLKGADGQLRPFLVATHPKKPGVFFVFGGGRRRLAYERLIGRGELPKDHPIEIRDFGNISVSEALSKSLADNQAVAMHPADQAATFAKLAADRSPEDIAKERGMTVRAVQQSIALGTDLIPEVLESWRAGKISREAVQVLVMADSDQQKEALEDLERDGPSGGAVRALRTDLMANKEAVMTRLLGFVGVEAARTGGVDVREDFFGQGGVVKDLKPLEKLANKKMKTLVQAELGSGWSWCEGKITEARGLHHGFGEQQAKPEYTDVEKKRLAEIAARDKALMERDDSTEAEDAEMASLEQEQELIEIAAKGRAYTAKQKAAGGVLINLNADGSVHYRRGIIKKAEKKSGKKPAGAGTAHSQREPEPLDYRARNALGNWQNDAIKNLLVKRPHDCVAAILTGAMHSGGDGPIRSNLDQDGASTRDFAGALARNRKLTPAKLIEALSAFINPSMCDWQGRPKKSAEPLIVMVGAKEYQAALAKAFDAKVYIGGASKKHMLGVMAEAFGAAARRDAEDKSEETLRGILTKEIGKTGWLPPELRTKAYGGPTAKAPAKIEKPAKAKKKGG